jgi:hypothetical protein
LGFKTKGMREMISKLLRIRGVGTRGLVEDVVTRMVMAVSEVNFDACLRDVVTVKKLIRPWPCTWS